MLETKKTTSTKKITSPNNAKILLKKKKSQKLLCGWEEYWRDEVLSMHGRLS